MWQKIKVYVLLVFLGAAGYFLLSYHIIYFGNTIKLLNKLRLTSEHTFISAAEETAESILSIDTLREAGIGNMLVEMGRLSPEEKELLEEKFNSDPVYY